MSIRIEPSWKTALENEFEQPYFVKLTDFVKDEYNTSTVYPQPKNIFRAFDKCPFDKVSVVILGQDPYHGEGQANGLSFSVDKGVPLPPSLRNIYKELENDVGVSRGNSGELDDWADQGVLLLNATLTVQSASPGSHQNKGWEEFTDAAIQSLSQDRENIVFILWGSYAQKKGAVIDRNKHLVLESAHPSPFSADRGFFGCRHFSATNTYLVMHDKNPIKW